MSRVVSGPSVIATDPWHGASSGFDWPTTSSSGRLALDDTRCSVGPN